MVEDRSQNQPIREPVAEPVSPCIGFCILDEYGYCGGCHRTMAEILAWPDMNDAHKREVLARVAARSEQKGRPKG
ncbi:DUF1289 domain-containing protein [bacterium]|nr:DUF1289 domain-containing protein [bacterium]